jgi:hypothetical protein
MDEEGEARPPEEELEFSKMSRGRRVLLVLILLGVGAAIAIFFLLLILYSRHSNSLELGALVDWAGLRWENAASHAL